MKIVDESEVKELQREEEEITMKRLMLHFTEIMSMYISVDNNDPK